MVPGLTPFSEYSLIVMTFNGRGNSPGSHPVNFKTPEGGRIVEKQHGLYWLYWESNDSQGIRDAEFDFLLWVLPSLTPQFQRKIRFSESQMYRSTLSLWSGPHHWSLMGLSPGTSLSISSVCILQLMLLQYNLIQCHQCWYSVSAVYMVNYCSCKTHKQT